MDKKRLLANLLLFTLFVFAPWWIYGPALLLCIVFFPLFLEGIVFAILADALYGPIGEGRILFGFPFGIISAFLVIILLPLRKYFRFNA